MEKVLTIDASVNPIELVVLGVEKTPEHTPASEGITILEAVRVNYDPESSSLGAAICLAGESLDGEWDTSILIVDGTDHISLNITLPFSDSRKVSKLIEPEVQDLLPFDLDDCVVSYQHVGSTPDAQSDFHVEVLPSSTLNETVSSLKGTRFEPRLVTTPGNILGGLYELFRRDLEPTALIVFESDHWIYLGVCINGQYVTERSIGIKNFLSHSSSQLAALIESAIRTIEARYQITLPLVYRIIQSGTSLYEIPDHRTVKELSMVTLFPRAHTKISVLHLIAAPFARDYPAPKLLGNFRVGNFKYRPSFQEAFKGVRNLLPLTTGLLIVVLIGLTSWYLSRQYTLRTLQTTLTKTIAEEVPSFTSEPGREAEMLQTMSQTLQDALKELGSPLGAPPLKILAEISEDFSSIEGVHVTRVSIRNGEVKIDGSVPNYKNLNRLEATLKKRRNLFCKTKTDSPTAGSRDNTRDFQMILTLCET